MAIDGTKILKRIFANNIQNEIFDLYDKNKLLSIPLYRITDKK